MKFRLKKPMYYRPGDAFGKFFRYVLSDELLAWLAAHEIEYTTNVDSFKKGDGIYLGYYLTINDPEKAMLFKLTWL